MRSRGNPPIYTCTLSASPPYNLNQLQNVDHHSPSCPFEPNRLFSKFIMSARARLHVSCPRGVHSSVTVRPLPSHSHLHNTNMKCNHDHDVTAAVARTPYFTLVCTQPRPQQLRTNVSSIMMQLPSLASSQLARKHHADAEYPI